MLQPSAPGNCAAPQQRTRPFLPGQAAERKCTEDTEVELRMERKDRDDQTEVVLVDTGRLPHKH